MTNTVTSNTPDKDEKIKITHTYIHIVIHRQICFVLSELISVAKHTSFP